MQVPRFAGPLARRTVEIKFSRADTAEPTGHSGARDIGIAVPIQGTGNEYFGVPVVICGGGDVRLVNVARGVLGFPGYRCADDGVSVLILDVNLGMHVLLVGWCSS